MTGKFFFLCLSLQGLAGTAFSQAVAGLGGLSGVVRDASGAVIPNAQVTVANESKGIRRSLVTNEAGVFAAPALVPSTGYSVKAAKDGFSPFEALGIEILVGQNISLNITLDVASAVTRVDVSESTPIVEQTKTGVSQVVNSAQILNLPINGRRVDSFVLLTPAVVSDGTFGLISFRGIAGGNSFLTDGNDTTQSFFNENAGRTRISSQISQDAVQEFQVLSSGYSAEFGRASGGVVNTLTRSGGNEPHGSAYWFFRNQDFNSRDRYSNINAPETRHQAGASAGGRIIRDKLFYFVNADVTRRDFPLVSTLVRAGLFDNGRFIGTCGATQAQCEAAIRYTQRHVQVLERRADQDLGFAKLDWRPTERHSLSASFNYLKWISPNGIQTQAVINTGSAVGNNGNSTVRSRYGRLSWTGVPSNRLVNEFRFGWMKDRQADEHNPALIPAETGLIQLTVQGQSRLGVADILPRLNPSEDRFQFADNVSYTLGRHTAKFGVDISSTEDLYSQLFNGAGSYSYDTFTLFAQDFSGNTTGARRWRTFSQTFGNPRIETTVREYAFFAQDQFRMTAKLTLNFGLRYDYTHIPQPRLVNPDYPQTGRIPSPKTTFGPRAGMAYAFNNARTVLRAGYGVFHARYPTGLINNTLHLANGIYQKSISLNAQVPADLAIGPVFPLPLTGIDRNPPAGTVDLNFAAADFRAPYTEQGDAGIEHQITPNLGLTVSYIWSRGLHLGTVRDSNVGAPGAPATYRINDAAGNQVASYTTATYRLANRVDPRWRRVNVTESAGNSYYNAMVVQMRKRMSRGLEGSVAYTWSHAIDYNQGGGRDNIFFSGGPRSLFNGDYRGDKSSSDLDQRHRLVLTSLHSPTFTKSTSAWARYLVNHWQLSQITTFASAQAQTPTIRISGVPFTGAAFTSTLNGFGGSSRAPFIPAASLDIDQVYRTDARLTKVLPVGERLQVLLNFEVFNVFNNVSNTSVNSEAFSASGGVLTPTPGLGVGFASQGFPDGTNARRAQFSARVVF